MTTLIEGLTVGTPDVVGPLAVFPLTTPGADLIYISFAEGSARGVTVTELPSGPSVNDVLVTNPLDVSVLLYEGEELLGAQQNRTVDAAVLVGPGLRVSVPVSCVEQDRWDGGRRHEAFVPSPQTAHPELRRAKSRRMRTALAAGAPARADQGEVWSMVGQGPMAETFRARRESLDELVAGLSRRDGQTGALVAVGGAFVVLDHVSQPDAFAALFAPLAQGYAHDALGRAAAPAPSVDAAHAWLAGLDAARVTRSHAVGLGARLAVTSAHCAGTGLALEDELVQLSVYAEDAVATRIARPSRRA